jgi:hypothetical protein
VPVSDSPNNEENSEPKEHEAFGPEQGKAQHPATRNNVILRRDYVVDVLQQFNRNET